MRRVSLPAACVSLLLLLSAAPANACSVSATGVSFGDYDAHRLAPLDGVGEVSLSCHPSVHSPQIALGSGSSGSFLARRMSNGASHLAYNLYTSPARLFVWGDGTGGSATVTPDPGDVAAGTRTFSVSIYGRIPAGQVQATPGVYGDTLFVTVIF